MFLMFILVVHFKAECRKIVLRCSPTGNEMIIIIITLFLERVSQRANMRGFDVCLRRVNQGNQHERVNIGV